VGAHCIVHVAERGIWGRVRGPVVRRLLRVTRQLLPTRDHHKFWMIRLLDLVKPMILTVGEHLMAEGRMDQVDDVWFLTMPALLAALEGATDALTVRIAARREPWRAIAA
jgi:hypothetical protein